MFLKALPTFKLTFFPCSPAFALMLYGPTSHLWCHSAVAQIAKICSFRIKAGAGRRTRREGRFLNCQVWKCSEQLIDLWITAEYKGQNCAHLCIFFLSDLKV